jgi:hypothetical protein
VNILPDIPQIAVLESHVWNDRADCFVFMTAVVEFVAKYVVVIFRGAIMLGYHGCDWLRRLSLLVDSIRSVYRDLYLKRKIIGGGCRTRVGRDRHNAW